MSTFREKSATALFAAALILLSGCSVLPGPESAAEITGREWQLDGKLGVWYEDSRESAKLDWLNCAGHYRIRLSGPLGASTTIIEGDESGVTLERSGEAPVSAETPDELARELGWPLPVSALRFWVRGRPVPQQPFSGVTDPAGHLSELQQLGWALTFERYRADAVAATPHLIELQNPALRARLLVGRWQESPASCTSQDIN